jgi:inosine-uridine nucleoside N-ribohydrolase
MILDVDTDIDDTMAILFALCGPRIVAAYISSPHKRQTEGRTDACLKEASAKAAIRDAGGSAGRSRAAGSARHGIESRDGRRRPSG